MSFVGSGPASFPSTCFSNLTHIKGNPKLRSKLQQMMNQLLAHCSAVFAGHGNLFALFFLGGLTGSVTHCLTMCGPSVACQAACAKNCGSKLSSASQWHYHLGRMMTYGALGFVASLFAKQLVALSFWPTLSASMLIAAGVLFLISGLFPGQHHVSFLTSKHGFLRGLLMGFMPCGLLYAALLVAATIPNPWRAVVAMECFALGTLPVLLAASSGAAILALHWRETMHRIGRIGLTFNGLVLLAMAANHTR